MEANKENHKCPIGKSKIPLPQDPLPPVPKHLTTEYKRKHEAVVCRPPLKILDSQPDQNVQTCSKTREPKKVLSQAGPSRERCVINTKYVTMRPRGDHNLDWGLKALKDDEPMSSTDVNPKKTDTQEEIQVPILHGIIRAGSSRRSGFFKDNGPTSSIDVNPKETDEKDVFNDAIILEENRVPILHDRILAGSSRRPFTPAFKPSSLEPARVKKLKKSLKRPHSRELQGLSSLGKGRKRFDDEKHNRERSFQNRERRPSLKFCRPDLSTIQLSERLNQYVPDIFDNLLKSEKMVSHTQHISKITRACVVNWLIKVNGPSGSPAVLQTACWFLDSIFERKDTPVAQLQLNASACYWIALKLNEPGVSSAYLVKISNNAFSESQLLAAERDILQYLGFPPQPVVPQEYISYFSWVCDPQNLGEIEMTATFFATCSLLFHIDFCCERPSVVAAAAMRNACICLGREDLAEMLGNCQVYKKAEAKAISFQRTCASQRIAVRTVLLPDFDYKAPFTHYDQSPLNLVQGVVHVISTLVELDKTIIGLQHFTLNSSKDSKF